MILENQWPAKKKGWASIQAKEIPEDLAPKFWKQTQNAKFQTTWIFWSYQH